MHKLKKKIPFIVLQMLGGMIPSPPKARGTTDCDHENCTPESSKKEDAEGNGTPKPKPWLESDNVQC
jgi:hypothetical protein